MKIFFSKLFIAIVVIGTLLVGVMVQAFDATNTGLDNTASTAGFQDPGGDADTALANIVGNIIDGALALIGLVLLAMLVWGGFDWMMAGGEPGKVTTAKGKITNSIIGLVIIFLAYAITNYVIEALIKATAS
jgi:hypothetical protein